MSSLFENQEWVGEFFIPDQYDNRFSGKVCYSIDEGVVLNYTVIIPSHKRTFLPQHINVLYGYLENGCKCTLAGEFQQSNLGIPLDGGHTVMRERGAFPLLILNDFVKPDDLYDEVVFTVTGIQEFFSSEKSRCSLRLSEPFLQAETSYGKVGIYSTAQLSPLLGIDSVIHSDDEVALQEIVDAYDKVNSSHPNSHFEHKGEVSHYVDIRLNRGLKISAIYEQVAETAGLFALLICSPVYPESISIITNRSGRPKGLELYPTIVAEKRTIALASSRRYHSLMPITHSHIDLGTALESWHTKLYHEYSVLVSAIQHETGFRTRHSLHGEIVIYSSQLESISKKEGRRKNHEKYDYAIEKYAAPEIQEGLRKLLKKVNTNKSLGEIISDLRADIAHVKIPSKKVLTKLSLQDLADLGRYLQLTIISYVLAELDVNEPRVKVYQNTFMPKHNLKGEGG